MKTTLICLLIGMANGTKHKKIKFDNKIWHLQDNFIYCCDGVSLEEYANILMCLNDEVEIIEETENIQFEKKFEKNYCPFVLDDLIPENKDIVKNFQRTEEIINQIMRNQNKLIKNQKKLIDAINELKGKSE